MRSFTQRLSRLCNRHPKLLTGMAKALPVVLTRICELGMCDVPAPAVWRARRIMQEQFTPALRTATGP